jgi:hypothetical protein
MPTTRMACWVIATIALRELLKVSGSLRLRYLCLKPRSMVFKGASFREGFLPSARAEHRILESPGLASKRESYRLSDGRVVAHARLVLHLRGTPATSQGLESLSSVGSVASPALDPCLKHSLYSTRVGRRASSGHSAACIRFPTIRRQIVQRFANPSSYYSHNQKTIN